MEIKTTEGKIVKIWPSDNRKYIAKYPQVLVNPKRQAKKLERRGY